MVYLALSREDQKSSTISATGPDGRGSTLIGLRCASGSAQAAAGRQPVAAAAPILPAEAIA